MPPIMTTAPQAQPRMFGQEDIDQQVAEILAGLPDDSRSAAIDVGVDAHGIQVIGVVKFEKGWSVQGRFEKRASGEWKGGASLRWVGR